MLRLLLIILCSTAIGFFSANYIRNYLTEARCTEGTTIHHYSTWEWMTKPLRCEFPDRDVWCEKGLVSKEFCATVSAIIKVSEQRYAARKREEREKGCIISCNRVYRDCQRKGLANCVGQKFDCISKCASCNLNAYATVPAYCIN